MKYNRPSATANWGTMAKDWELSVDYSRLVRERFDRAQAAVKAAGLGAVLGGRRRLEHLAAVVAVVRLEG